MHSVILCLFDFPSCGLTACEVDYFIGQKKTWKHQPHRISGSKWKEHESLRSFFYNGLHCTALSGVVLSPLFVYFNRYIFFRNTFACQSFCHQFFALREYAIRL